MRTAHVAALTLILAWPAGPLHAQVEIERPAIALPQARVLERVTLAQGPSIVTEALACLPLERNGVVTAKVLNEPLAARVRIQFRRVNPEQGDFYYVHAEPQGESRYSGVLPLPTDAVTGSADPRRRLSAVSGDAQLERVAAIRRRLELRRGEISAERYERELERLAELTGRVRAEAPSAYEPVEVFAELVDPAGAVLATSPRTTVPVTEDCSAVGWVRPGQEKNLVLGETAAWQGEGEPFHWRCTGIVTRIDHLGVLWPDGFCRDYLVPREREGRVLFNISLPPARETETVTVFYGTDRRRSGQSAPAAFYGGGRGSLELGTCEVSIPAGHVMGELESPGIFEGADPNRHVLLLAVDPTSRASFTSDLRARIAASPGRDALVFVHGYNVSFEDAARRTAQISFDLGFGGAPLMYSWPSQAALQGYPVDEANIRWTVPHLREFLDLVVESSEAETIHVIAHSMGNRAVTEVLRRYAAETADGSSGAPAPRFNQVVLVAPDVDADVFRDEIAPGILGVAERVTLYASTHDKALKVSKGVHGHPRAGDLSDGVVVVSGVETIDASEASTGVFQAFDLGHSYFADTQSVLVDLRGLLAGRGAAQRSLTARSFEGLPYWKFLPN